MGTLFLLIPALLVIDAVTLFGLVLKPWVLHLRAVGTIAALALAVVAWIGGIIMPRTVEMEVEMPRLPAAADGLVVVHLSDIHLGSIIGKRRLSAIIERVETLRPDIVAITGDLVDADAGLVETLLPQLKTLTAPLGVYSVLGNHEMYAGAERSTALMRDAGYTVLDSSAVEAAPGLWIVGIPDVRGSRQTGRPPAELEQALAEAGEGAIILLQHAPENHEVAADAGVGLMLDGHTHGAQIWPAHYLVRRAFPHLAGAYKVGDMTQVVSRGAGQWGPPMRLFARSEIIRITLRSPKAAR
jgi:predicted MPP superfamily phosphohydrolase